MANECYNKKLKGIVNNNKWVGLGEFLIECIDGVGSFRYNGSGTLTVVNDGHVTDSSGTSDFGKTASLSNVLTYVTQGSIFKVNGKYTNAKYINGSNLRIDIGDLIYCNPYAYFLNNSGELYGDVSALAYFGNCTTLKFKDTKGIYGEIPTVTLTSMNDMNLQSDQLYGNFFNLSMPAITNMYIGGKNVEGNMSGLALSCPNLGRLYGQDFKKLSGNISSISNLTSLFHLQINNTQVQGEMTDLADGLVASGKTSGTLTIYGNGIMTCNSIVVANNTTKVFKFGSSMVNPTADETTQGWQIS